MDKSIKKFSSRMQARLLLVFCVITLLLVGLMGRLIYILQVDGERYAKQVLSRDTYVNSVIPYKRGEILDRNGVVLAQSVLTYRLILDPKRLLENEDKISTTLKALNDNFQLDTAEVQAVIQDNPNSQYYTLLKNLNYEQKTSFEALMKEDKKIIGVWFDEEYIRTYPYATLACDILGFTSTDNIGYFGIEEYYNEELNGINGREYGYYNSELDIERIVKKAVNGNSIVSTIDVNAQRIIQKHIREFNSEFGSKNIGVLLMNPNNGDIIAMASNQEYDLNKPRTLEGIYSDEVLASMTDEEKTLALNTLWKNDVISFGYEPGSTFKPVTVAAALEESLVSANSTFICDGGEHIGGVDISCSNRYGHGVLDLGQSIMYSCNDALMQIAAMEGRNTFYQYNNSFNFGKKTGIDLPGEETGIIMSLDKLNATELATVSFGQGFNTTMVQLAAAYSSIVNGGYYYVPHVMKRIVNDNGATVKEYDKLLVRQTVSKQTSELLQQYLYHTVEEGTAKPAKVEGYSVGGKTGTAQKLPRDAKTYIVSFIGSVPAINPELVIYVIIDEPQNVEKQADSSIATKFASRILKEVLPALGIYPEGDIDYLLPAEEEGEAANNEGSASNQAGSGNNSENNSSDENGSGEQNDSNSPSEDDDSHGEGAAQNNEGNSNTAPGTENNSGDTENNNTEDDPVNKGEDNGENNGATDPPPDSSGQEDNGQNAGEGTPGLEDYEFNPDALSF